MKEEKNNEKKEYQVFYTYKEGEYIRKKIVKDNKELKCDNYRYVNTKNKDTKLLICITKDKKIIPISLLIKKESPTGKYILRRYKVIVIDKESENNIIPSTSGNIFNY